MFKFVWRTTNALLVLCLAGMVYSAGWEYSVRQYLQGFSDAVVPAYATPEQKVEAILSWMRSGPPRAVAINPDALSQRDPETTLNYKQLLSVCGTATNAFLNLARSSGLSVRRLLLLTPERTTKHVVAEVLLNENWVIVDPTYRIMMRDKQGRMLNRHDLQNPVLFEEAISAVSNYPAVYDYATFAHVRIARLPLQGLHVRALLDKIYAGWDEVIDWSLLLERESFFVLCVFIAGSSFLLFLRELMAWFADRRLKIPRFHLRAHFARAGAAFFGAPEIKQ
ncbi:MAG: transglutaminase domain-containing protein [Acidobacteria bacterium]|nr:transglutaminase domain-containing protein [Acidobacteriota bacterium]MBS1864904.1 transglutaminase domain-containing protein [Acidobacteriota bacterium]